MHKIKMYLQRRACNGYAIDDAYPKKDYYTWLSARRKKYHEVLNVLLMARTGSEQVTLSAVSDRLCKNNQVMRMSEDPQICNTHPNLDTEQV